MKKSTENFMQFFATPSWVAGSSFRAESLQSSLRISLKSEKSRRAKAQAGPGFPVAEQGLDMTKIWRTTGPPVEPRRSQQAVASSWKKTVKEIIFRTSRSVPHPDKK